MRTNAGHEHLRLGSMPAVDLVELIYLDTNLARRLR